MTSPRALLRARLSEKDVAAHLGVDPKTVRCWTDGRIPYPRHRWALAGLAARRRTRPGPGRLAGGRGRGRLPASVARTAQGLAPRPTCTCTRWWQSSATQPVVVYLIHRSARPVMTGADRELTGKDALAFRCARSSDTDDQGLTGRNTIGLDRASDVALDPTVTHFGCYGRRSQTDGGPVRMLILIQ